MAGPIAGASSEAAPNAQAGQTERAESHTRAATPTRKTPSQGLASTLQRFTVPARFAPSPWESNDVSQQPHQKTPVRRDVWIPAVEDRGGRRAEGITNNASAPSTNDQPVELAHFSGTPHSNTKAHAPGINRSMA